MSAAGAIAPMAADRREHTATVHRKGGRGSVRALPAKPSGPAEGQADTVAEMQRRRLLMAVVEVVASEGLEGATVGAICRRAGVSRRTFYDLFEDRQACFVAALETTVAQLTDELVGAWESRERWRERVRAGLTVLLQRFERDRALARTCLVESLKGGVAVLERRRALLDALAALVEQGGKEAKIGVSAPPELTAESIVGGALGVIQARVLDPASPSLIGLLNPLMSMIVQPYLGPAAARRELEIAVPADQPAARERKHAPAGPSSGDVFEGLPIRITFRTARVLETIGSHPDASNRDVAAAAGMSDQGQASRLLRRLQRAELIENFGYGQSRGEPNAWRLTVRGSALLDTVGMTR